MVVCVLFSSSQKQEEGRQPVPLPLPCHSWFQASFWKYSCADDILKGSWLNLYLMNVVINDDSGDGSICQNPELASSLGSIWRLQFGLKCGQQMVKCVFFSWHIDSVLSCRSSLCSWVKGSRLGFRVYDSRLHPEASLLYYICGIWPFCQGKGLSQEDGLYHILYNFALMGI